MHRLKKHKSSVLIFILLLLSLYPRLWNLNISPPLIVDEAANIREVTDIHNSGRFDIFEFYWDYSMSRIIYAPTIAILKIQLSTDLLSALRLNSIIQSLIIIIVLFLLIKKLTNSIVAFSASLLFSYSYYFLQFSRVGWVNITVLLLGLPLFLFLSIWKIKRKDYLLIIAGLFAGLTFYNYRAGLIYIASGFIYLLMHSFHNKYHFSLKNSLKSVLIFSISFGCVAAPWINIIRQNPDKYNLRYRVVNIKYTEIPYHGLTEKEDIWVYQIRTTIKSWFFLSSVNGGGSENPRYLPYNHPPVNFAIKILFLIGFIIALTKFKDTFHWFLVYFSALIFGQILTTHPPNGARALIILPVIYLFSSLTLFEIYKKFGRYRFAALTMVIVSVIISIWDFMFYKDWMSWIKV
jgi:4-amino-4-deoxy-L-arabinose transferase-like glycosyltransferase